MTVEPPIIHPQIIHCFSKCLRTSSTDICSHIMIHILSPPRIMSTSDGQPERLIRPVCRRNPNRTPSVEETLTTYFVRYKIQRRFLQEKYIFKHLLNTNRNTINENYEKHYFAKVGWQLDESNYWNSCINTPL